MASLSKTFRPRKNRVFGTGRAICSTTTKVCVERAEESSLTVGIIWSGLVLRTSPSLGLLLVTSYSYIAQPCVNRTKCRCGGGPNA